MFYMKINVFLLEGKQGEVLLGILRNLQCAVQVSQEIEYHANAFTIYIKNKNIFDVNTENSLSSYRFTCTKLEML